MLLFTNADWREPVEFMHHCSTKWGYHLLGLKGGKGHPIPRRHRPQRQLALTAAWTRSSGAGRPSSRRLPGSLSQRTGQTPRGLCAGQEMTRQSLPGRVQRATMSV